jgi:hypothetical protein
VIERIFQCDGPDCTAHQRTAARAPRYWLIVREVELYGEDGDHEFHFCGWECVLKKAATYDPPEVIPLDGNQ